MNKSFVFKDWFQFHKDKTLIYINCNGCTQEFLDNHNLTLEEYEKMNESNTHCWNCYDCKNCNDTGYITNENNRKIMCNCLKQKLLNEAFNNSNISNLHKENFTKFTPLMYSDEVDIAKFKFNISPRKNILNIKEKAIEFIENFDNSNYKNLLFTGNSGLR